MDAHFAGGTIATASSLSELEFSDLYLGHPELDDRLCAAPGGPAQPLPPGAALREDARRLTQACIAGRRGASGADEFRVGHEGVSYRVSMLPAQGGNVFVVRRIPGAVRSLAELGIPQAYVRRMLLRELSGLFIVSGAIASGKTMTAGAMLKERLCAHGGLAATGEDPVELPLEGGHGQGLCFQTVLPARLGGFAAGFRSMTRWRAGTLLIDEIRDGEAAEALLKAGIGGNLVIATMLADDLVRTVTRLQALLNERMCQEHARALLADGLLGVLHQKLVRDPRRPPRMDAQLLFLKDAPSARAVLRKGEFEQLATEIAKQMAVMIAENALAQRHVTA